MENSHLSHKHTHATKNQIIKIQLKKKNCLFVCLLFFPFCVSLSTHSLFVLPFLSYNIELPLTFFRRGKKPNGGQRERERGEEERGGRVEKGEARELEFFFFFSFPRFHFPNGYHLIRYPRVTTNNVPNV